MLRITGILIGSALAVALLIIILGVPEIGTPDVEPVTWSESAVELPQQVASVDVPETPIQVPELVAEIAAEPDVEPPPESTPEAPATLDEALVDAIFAPADERPSEIIQDNWYAFWSPFRSEIAANGFVEQLQRSTGLDYRVVKQKPGVYEVAFAYDDAGDIQTKLDTIAAATGLEMPDG